MRGKSVEESESSESCGSGTSRSRIQSINSDTGVYLIDNKSKFYLLPPRKNFVFGN